jgi:pullulanase-type alpha-1,6-glucosidase
MAAAASDCYNWGYDPLHFGAPEGSYASDAVDGAVRIREFRAMVQALHRVGLRVGMDMVYNHSSAAGQHVHSVLDRVVPGYYQRLNAQGGVESSTCCANTATEHRMMAKLMVDTAVVWARDHRIDSLRFDLMGHQPRAAMEQLQQAVDRAAGRHIHLIGEGWNFGEVANGARFVQASQNTLNGSGIATFSDRGRDAVRGGGCCDSTPEAVARQGWLNGQFYAPNGSAAAGTATRDDLLRSADLVRVGLAGTLRGVRMTTRDGNVKALADIDYAGQPAGYASQPGEVVNYVENHDNPTLFDINVLKLPLDTTREDRARVQVLGLAVTAFSQGIAYFHAGVELLRSKSGDRNSFDSGDWFNRLDWTATDNHFGSGLPPQADNAPLWPVLKPLLANAAIKPGPAEIAFTRDAFLDLLRIRSSSALFRLRTADEVAARLTLHNTGPAQEPTVVVGQLDGRDLAGAGYSEVLYAINVSPQAVVLPLPALRGRAYRLHPVHRAADAADKRPVEASRWNADTGTLTLPPRTALVYVLD